MKYATNISWWVERWGKQHPDKTAIIFEDNHISYRELHQQVCHICAWFKSMGLTRGQRVAILIKNCPEFIEIYLACSRLGLILVPLNTRWAPDEIYWAIDNAEPQMLIFDTCHTEVILGHNGHWPLTHIRLLAMGTSRAPSVKAYHAEMTRFERKPGTQEETARPIDPESPQVIMYTSGSTGHPKGAVLPLRKTFFNCLNAQIFMDLKGEDRILLTIPLYHSGGLFIISSPTLYAGATLVMRTRFDAPTTWRDIETYRITKCAAVPTIMKKLLAVDPQRRADISSLVFFGIGGEKVSTDLLRQCRAAGFPMQQIMGQTETSIILWASEKDLIDHPGTVGRPVFHGQVELFDSKGNPAGPQEIGEIAVTGPTIMSGYWRLPEINRRTIRGDWLFTGDLARRDEAGYFYLVDRSTEIYISGGENVYPAEVERVLKSHPGIREAAVVGIPDPNWGQTGHAFIAKKADTELSERDILAFCEGRLARFKWPKTITFKEKFERTALGKIKKTSLI